MHSAVSAFSPRRALMSGNVYYIFGTMTGLVNSSTGAMSFWVKSYDNGLTGTRSIMSSTGVNIGLTGSENLTITLNNGADTITAVSTSFQLLTSNAENHIAVEWDTNAAAGSKKLKAYVDGTEIAMTITDTSPAFTLAYAAISTIRFCNLSVLGLGEVMAWFGNAPAFPATLAKLRTTLNTPADVGEKAQYLPSRPDVYLSLRGANAPKSFASNRGKSGGTLAFVSATAFHDHTRIVGYGDSNMANTYATTYTSKLGLQLPLKLEVANHGVANATLTSIAGYITNGGIQGRPSIAYIKANWPDAIFVLEGGGNSLPTDGTGGVTSTTLLAQWAAIVSAVTSALPDARFIVQGISSRVTSEFGTYKGTVLQEVNAGLAAIHGSKYFDVNTYLLSDQAFTDAGYTKTAQDITDISNQIVPASFRADVTHLNQKAHDLLLPRALALMQSLGYV